MDSKKRHKGKQGHGTGVEHCTDVCSCDVMIEAAGTGVHSSLVSILTRSFSSADESHNSGTKSSQNTFAKASNTSDLTAGPDKVLLCSA